MKREMYIQCTTTPNGVVVYLYTHKANSCELFGPLFVFLGLGLSDEKVPVHNPY